MQIYKSDIIHIIDIAKDAGNAILDIYSADFEVYYKKDKSPLTQADILANQIICDSLSQSYPNIPILSEENKSVPYSERSHWDYFWCIDPIDGTKEFVHKQNEFTINIALIQNDTPMLGVVYAPALDICYWATADEGAFKIEGNNIDISLSQKLPLQSGHNSQGAFTPKKITPKEFIVVASKNHRTAETDAFIDELKYTHPNLVLTSIGSSLKICLVAEESADIYPRIAPTSEWDTAAAHAIALYSGKRILQYDSGINPQEYLHSHNQSLLPLVPLVYNKKDILNPPFVVV